VEGGNKNRVERVDRVKGDGQWALRGASIYTFLEFQEKILLGRNSTFCKL
jgi:hypothetical protein